MFFCRFLFFCPPVFHLTNILTQDPEQIHVNDLGKMKKLYSDLKL